MPRKSKAKSAGKNNAHFASEFKRVKGEVPNGSRESSRSSAKVAKQSSLAQETRRRLAAADSSSDEADNDDLVDDAYLDQDESKLVDGAVVTAEERQTARQVALMSTFLTKPSTPAAMTPTARKSPDSSRMSDHLESGNSDTDSSCGSVASVSSADSMDSIWGKRGGGSVSGSSGEDGLLEEHDGDVSESSVDDGEGPPSDGAGGGCGSDDGGCAPRTAPSRTSGRSHGLAGGGWMRTRRGSRGQWRRSRCANVASIAV